MITDADRACFRAYQAYEDARRRREDLCARRHVAEAHGASADDMQAWDAAIEQARTVEQATGGVLAAAFEASKRSVE